MKKFLLSLLCLISFMAINAEEPVVTMTPTTSNMTKTNGYTENLTLTQTEGTWTIYGFNNYNLGWATNPMRCGRKNQNSAEAKISTDFAITATINKIEIDVTRTNTGGSITSLKLKVCEDNTFTTTSDYTIDVTNQPTSKKGKATFSVDITEPSANKYYQLYFDIKGGTNNGLLAVDAVRYYGAVSESSVSFPVISPNGGTYYEAQLVEITCATEGATIYYTLDGSEPNANSSVYSGAIQVSETTTIKAIAIKGEENSGIVTSTITIEKPLDNIAQFYNIEVGKTVKFANPVTVVYQNGSNLIVKDNSSSMLIYGTTNENYNNGDVIAAGLIGTVKEYAQYYELVPIEIPTATPGTAVEPKAVTVAKLADCNFLDYVKVEDVTFTLDPTDTKNKTYTISDGSKSFTVYNQFNLTINNLGDGNLFDVTGFVSSYNGKTQFQPTSVVYDDTATGIEDTMVDENAPVEYYNLQGVKVANPENGIFIKKQGGRTNKVVL